MLVNSENNSTNDETGPVFRLLFIMLLAGSAVLIAGLFAALALDWIDTNQGILLFKLFSLGGTFLGAAMCWSAVLWQQDHELPMWRNFAIISTGLFVLQLLIFFVL